MDAFNNTEENNRSREEALKAREIKVRLQEIEQELESMPSSKQANARHQNTAVKSMETKHLPFQLSKATRFWLIVIAVIVGIRLLNVLSAAVMIMSITWMPPLIILGLAWIVYKLFYEEEG